MLLAISFGLSTAKSLSTAHDRHIAGRRDERALVKWPAHVIIPVAETSREDRSESSAQPGTPIKSGNKYDQSTPVKTSKNPIRSTSVISSNSPQRSMPVNAGNSPERSMPVNAPNSPERSVPVNAGNSPERGMPVNAGNKPDGIRIPSFQITDHGELVKDQERRQEEHAGAMQRDIHTHERAFGEKSEYQESSASLDNASQGDAPMTSEDESGTLKRPLSGPSEDRDSSKRHKSVHENEDEEEVLMED